MGTTRKTGEFVEQGVVGAVEAVDGLVRVTHHEEIRRITHEKPEEPVLERVEVLCLIDRHVPELVAHGCGEPVVAFGLAHHLRDEVVRVHHTAAALEGLVPRENGIELVGAHVAQAGRAHGALHRATLQHPHGHVVDGDCKRGKLRLLDVAARRRRENRHAVGDDEWLRLPLVGSALGQQPQTECVERVDLRRTVNAETAQAGAHLCRRLPGEGDREDMVGGGGVAGHAPRDAAGENCRLSRPRTCTHHHDALRRGDCGTLVVIQSREDVVRGQRCLIHQVASHTTKLGGGYHRCHALPAPVAE